MMDNRNIVKKNLLLVGTLQDFGRPYASLFFDRDSSALYLLVRLLGTPAGDNTAYLAKYVTPEDVSRYMKGEIGLRSLFGHSGYSIVTFAGGTACFNIPDSNQTGDRIEREDRFNPRFCHDKLKLKIFLKRFPNV